MERGIPSITVEADVYNSMLITYKTLRMAEKNDFPIIIQATRAKSVEIEIALKILEQVGRRVGEGALAGAGALAVRELYRYLKNRIRKVDEKRKKRPRVDERTVIRRQTTEWREIIRSYHDDDDDGEDENRFDRRTSDRCTA